ncbi:hypothetical protein PG996_005255 [Apiospora saccharicola]|uniref:Uncharacterized protein n=1 Tax=Apiospora saccharicola TaxID=335842 RepID=A0ABR1VL82_9PEZI
MDKDHAHGRTPLAIFATWGAYRLGKYLVVIATSPSLKSTGAYDSAFLRGTSMDNSMVDNQKFNATVALDVGRCLLQARVHNKNGAIEFCHTMCHLLNAGRA